MPNDNQFKLKTLFIGTCGVKEYRASIEKYINKDDVVLEVGCEWGTTAELIQTKCKELLATDVSLKCIKRARKMRPEIRFETLDVYDVRRAQSFGIEFNKMYLDVSGLSGYRSHLDVLALLIMYGTVFDMEVIVAKSGALKEIGRRVIPWSNELLES